MKKSSLHDHEMAMRILSTLKVAARGFASWDEMGQGKVGLDGKSAIESWSGV